MVLVSSISSFFINKMSLANKWTRKKIPSFCNLALWAVSNWIHSYLSTFLPLTEKKVVKTWLKFKFRINNICSTNIAAFLLCLPKIIYYLQIVTVRPHCNTYFLLLLSTQGRRKHSGTWGYKGSKSKSLKSSYLMMFQLKLVILDQ